VTGNDLTARLEGQVRVCLEQTGLARKGALLVMASSGGPDSQALLYALLSLREEMGLRLHLAHLDHDFRGEEAKEDARFVASQARELSLPSTVAEADPMAYQKEQRISSFEAAAREVRYDFLARVATETDAAAVALGHTADDRAETVLMHIIRGTGLHGLRGMEPVSLWKHPRKDVSTTLVRPLLEVAKADTEAYCRQRGIPYRIDTTNVSLRFARNRIRWKLMPNLRSYNPRIREALLRLARTASQQVSYMEQEVERAWSNVSSMPGPSSVALDADAMAALHPFLQAQLLRRAYEEVVGGPQALEEAHIQAMQELLKAAPGHTLHLPQGVRMAAGYGQVVMGRGDAGLSPLPPLEGEYTLGVPGETRIPGWAVRAEVLEKAPAELPDGRSSACFDMEAVGERLVVRARRRGDRMQPLGMEGSRKLHDLFVDMKVPRHWRDRVPLVASERGILWVVGYRTAHWARVREGTGDVLRLSFRPGTDE
jgi:tRNA(Ile)-lysidine synthase